MTFVSELAEKRYQILRSVYLRFTGFSIHHSGQGFLLWSKFRKSFLWSLNSWVKSLQLILEGLCRHFLVIFGWWFLLKVALVVVKFFRFSAVKWRFHVPAVGSTGFLLHVPFSKTTEVSSCREERGRLIIIKLMTITHHHLQLIVFYLFVLKYSASYYYVIFLFLLIKIWGRLFKGGLVLTLG